MTEGFECRFDLVGSINRVDTNLNKLGASSACATAGNVCRGGPLNNICKDEATVDLAKHHARSMIIVRVISMEVRGFFNIIMVGAREEEGCVISRFVMRK